MKVHVQTCQHSISESSIKVFAMTESKARLEPIGLATPSGVARRYGLTRGAVIAAIHAGRLPAYRAESGLDYAAFLIADQDAYELWGSRLAELALT